MKKTFDVMPLFPTPIGMVQLDVDDKAMLKWMKKLKYKKYVSDHNLNSYQTIDMRLMKQLPKFKKAASEAVAAYIRDIWSYKCGFQFNTCWATKNLPEGYAGIHKHANNWLSAIYYPEACSAVTFNRIPMLEWDTTRHRINDFNCNSWRLKPVKNCFIMFPAQLPHSTEPNDSKTARYSLAMNIIPKGDFGMNDSTVTYK
jgi:hypothetical protein